MKSAKRMGPWPGAYLSAGECGGQKAARPRGKARGKAQPRVQSAAILPGHCAKQEARLKGILILGEILL